MFNLTNLLQTMIITIGVANATPICDKQQKKEPNKITTIKKENSNSPVTTDYTLYLSQIGTYDTDYTGMQVHEGFTGIDTEGIVNYQVSSNYLNINASQYYTKTERRINNEYRSYFQNYETIQGNLDNLYAYRRQQLIVMQITPYNYNVNTAAEITLTLAANDWVDSNGDEIIVDKKYILTNTYTTTNDWSSYINYSLVPFTSQTILNDIESANSNFYYTKETKLEEITQNTGDITITINLEPNKTNYVMINLTPVIKALYYDRHNQQLTNFGTLASTIPLDQVNNDITGIYISGRNVIPGDITTEVIDIPGLMWQILTMPFAFVSQAFNLTLFPNTPYQINISNLFLSIVAIVVFVWLIGFFLKMKG